MYSERGMYFVTARTFQARMLLTPGPGVNAVIGGALARAVALTGVELHGFVVTSNHVHLLVTAKGASLSFVLGGEFALSNLYSASEVESMRYRGWLSKQLAEVQDGGYVQFEVMRPVVPTRRTTPRRSR